MSPQILPLRRLDGAPPEMSDEALVAACAVGESAALGALFDRHHDAARRFLARMSGTDDRDLDDLVQVTFEAVPRAARSFDGRASVRTWLLGIANNVVRHHVRAEVARKRLARSVAALPLPSSTDATAEILDRERTARLHAAVLALPDKIREAFVLVYLEGVPGKEVADLLGVGEGTIWKRLFQARALLKGAMEKSR
jgi:RNA polymerase sigma-70 factor (ECF subfamily)